MRVMIYFKHILLCLHDLFKVTFEYIESRNACTCPPLTHRITSSGSFIFLMYKATHQLLRGFHLANSLICNIIGSEKISKTYLQIIVSMCIHCIDNYHGKSAIYIYFLQKYLWGSNLSSGKYRKDWNYLFEVT